MPTIAIVETRLTTAGTQPFRLTVGSVDLDVTRAHGSAWSVPIESIAIDEQGPGGVSSMDFDIWDPTRAVSIPEMAMVEFRDVTNGIALFAGFVQGTNLQAAAAGQRVIHVRCVGAEALLDWMVMPAFTTAGMVNTFTVGDAIQAFAGIASGTGVPLNAARDPSTNFGDATTPVGALFATGADTLVLSGGETLREAIRLADANVLAPGIAPLNERAAWTVDFTWNLRAWEYTNWANDGPYAPNDYATLNVANNAAGPVRAATVEYESDFLGTTRGVYVQGGNAAGSGLVPDGSGIPGPIATLSDSSILTTSARNSAGQAYLTDRQSGIRGTLTIDAWSPTDNYRAGSILHLIDDATGVDKLLVISSIQKRFLAGGTKQDWTVAFGALPPSAMRLTRRLTRATRA